MNKETFPIWNFLHRAAIGSSQVAFPITVLPKDDRTDSAQEEQLDLQYWTMILTICVMVDESKRLHIPIWEFSVILVHPPFLLGFSRYCVCCLSIATGQSGNDTHDLGGCSVNTAQDPESSFTISPRSTTRPLYFLVFCLQFSIFQMTCSLVMQNEL